MNKKSIIDYDPLFNVLAVLSFAGALFIAIALPFVFDTPEDVDPPKNGNFDLLRCFSFHYEPIDPTPAFEIKANVENAKANLESAKAIFDEIDKVADSIEIKGYVLEYAGEFYLTMYSNTVEQCGNTLGITASGKMVTTDPTCRTVAVDPSVIPLGTYLIIEGYPSIIWEATDTGSAVKGKHCDLYTDDVAESINFPNVSGAKVWIITDFIGDGK